MNKIEEKEKKEGIPSLYDSMFNRLMNLGEILIESLKKKVKSID